MTTAGPNSPASVSSVLIGFETVPWSDPGNAVVSDDSAATAFIDDLNLTYWLRCTDLGFTNGDVPPGATLDGFLVEVEVSQDGGAVLAGAKPVYDGLQISAGNLGSEAGNFPFTPDGTDTYWPLGGPTDLSGATITQDMVVDPSFGIDLQFSVSSFSGGSPSTVSVDHVRLTVYYTEADPDGNASGDIGTVTLSGPTATASGGSSGGDASGSIGTVTRTNPAASATGGAGASGAGTTVTVSGPAASGAGSANASGAIGTVSVSSVAGQATVSVTAAGALATVAVSAPAGSAAGGAAASGGLSIVSTSPAEASAAGAGSGAGVLGTVGCSGPGASAIGAGAAAGGFGTITIATITGTVSISLPMAPPPSRTTKAPMRHGSSLAQARNRTTIAPRRFAQG